ARGRRRGHRGGVREDGRRPAHRPGRRRARHPRADGRGGAVHHRVRAGEPHRGPAVPGARRPAAPHRRRPRGIRSRHVGLHHRAERGDRVMSLQTLTRDQAPAPTPARSRARRLPALRPTVVLSALVLLLAITWALAPGLFTSYGATASVGPSLQAPSAEHWFGTDATGRDMFSRVVHGASHSITAALVAVAVGLVVGTTIGVVAGSDGGFIEDVLMRVVDVLLAIPAPLLSLSVVILLGFGPTNAAIAVGVTSIATFARLSRSRVLEVRGSEYVVPAFGSGGTLPAILRRADLPNPAAAVTALAPQRPCAAVWPRPTRPLPGHGPPPPPPVPGLLLAQGRGYVATARCLTLLRRLRVEAPLPPPNRRGDSVAQVDL